MVGGGRLADRSDFAVRTSLFVTASGSREGRGPSVLILIPRRKFCVTAVVVCEGEDCSEMLTPIGSKGEEKSRRITPEPVTTYPGLR